MKCALCEKKLTKEELKEDVPICDDCNENGNEDDINEVWQEYVDDKEEE